MTKRASHTRLRSALFAGAALMVGSFGFASQAHADPLSFAAAEQNRLAADLDIWSAKSGPEGSEVSTLGLGFTLWGQYEVIPFVFVGGELPLGYGLTDPQNADGDGALLLGNPTVSGYIADTLPVSDMQLSLKLGASSSVPTIFEPAADRIAAVGYVTGARGLYDAHRFFPEHVPVRVLTGAELQVNPNVYVRAELNPAFYLPLEGDFAFFVENAAELEGRADAGFGGGARYQQVIMPTENDKIQTAIEPFLAYTPSDGPSIFARVGFLMALDGSLGFAFDSGGVFALRTTVGAAF